MPKNLLTMIITLLMLSCIAVCSSLRIAHADDLSDGIELVKQKRYEEATPILEKAAKEGRDEALEVLDKIYAKEASPTKDSSKNKAASVANADETTSDGVAEKAIPVSPIQNTEKASTATHEENTVATSSAKASRKYYIKLFIVCTLVLFVIFWFFRRLKATRNKRR